MKHKSYFRVAAFSLALVIATSLWFASPFMHCYVQGNGYGGAGGGGGGTTPPAGVNFIGNKMTTDGALIQDVTATSFDGLGQLTINQGTMVLQNWGVPLYWIIMLGMPDPPAPPAGFKIIGQVYNFAPDGATFKQTATLTFTYDPTSLPEGFCCQCLVVAMWDETAGKWIILESTVDPNTNTITAQIKHFTAFAILAKTTAATLTVTDLTIAPGEVNIGEKVTISTLINNTGCLSGSYEVTLKINDVVRATENVTLTALASQKVTFTISEDVSGTYAVDVSGLAGTLVVSSIAPPPPVPPPPPAPPVPPPAPPVTVINWYYIAIIIGGCIIIGIAIWLAIRRRIAL